MSKLKGFCPALQSGFLLSMPLRKEGDKSLAYWRQVHEDFHRLFGWSRTNFTPDSRLFLEEFRRSTRMAVGQERKFSKVPSNPFFLKQNIIISLFEEELTALKLRIRGERKHASSWTFYCNLFLNIMIYFRLESWPRPWVTITGQAQSDRISLHQRLGNRFCRIAGQVCHYSWPWQNEALHFELGSRRVEVVIAFGEKSQITWRGFTFLLHSGRNFVYSVRNPFCAGSLPMCGWTRSQSNFLISLFVWPSRRWELALSNMPEISWKP